MEFIFNALFTFIIFVCLQTSEILSFSHNLAVVAMECEGEDQLNLLTFHQERPVEIPGCGGLLCPLSNFLDILQPIIDLDWDAICKYDQHQQGQ